MNDRFQKWLSLSGAAAYLDVSDDTILRRAIPFDEKNPDGWVEGKIRWKYLKLGQNTRQDRRYIVDDLDRLLVPAV